MTSPWADGDDAEDQHYRHIMDVALRLADIVAAEKNLTTFSDVSYAIAGFISLVLNGMFDPEKADRHLQQIIQLTQSAPGFADKKEPEFSADVEFIQWTEEAAKGALISLLPRDGGYDYGKIMAIIGSMIAIAMKGIPPKYRDGILAWTMEVAKAQMTDKLDVAKFMHTMESIRVMMSTK